jgi:hypothetical protein
MRLPTFAGLTDATRRVVARFPETSAVAVVAAVFATLTVHDDPMHPSHWPGWWAAAGLGISAFFVVAMAAERMGPAGRGFGAPRVAGALIALALLVTFALRWNGWSDPVRFHRVVQFGIAIHLIAAFVPFVGGRERNAFWQYNRILFVRFLTGALFSAVLFVGLAIAIASAKPLFGIRVHERTYFDLWFAIVFVFNTGYVLAGVPEDVAALERETHYPGGLKVFAQFILVPLVAVYLAILTAYLVKVLVTGQWPQGWIGWLVSSVSAAGLLSLLLVHPVRDRAENRWVATYARWFYIALMPSVAMLFAAIGKRIGQYGFTEDRYFLLALACWIAVICVGYTLRRAADIRWIPISLCLLAIATSFGPWGAYGVSRSDQVARLGRALRRHGLVGDAGLTLAAPVLGVADRKELSSGITYVAGTHGVASLPPLLRQLALADSAVRAAHQAGARPARGEEVAQAVLRALGVAYVAPWESIESRQISLNLGPVGSHVEPISDLDLAVSLQGALPIAFAIDGAEGMLWLDPRARSLALTVPWAHWTFPLDSTIRDLELRGPPRWDGTPRPPLRLAAADGGIPARLVLREFGGTLQGDTLAYVHVGGDLYMARTRPGPAAADARGVR